MTKREKRAADEPLHPLVTRSHLFDFLLDKTRVQAATITLKIPEPQAPGPRRLRISGDSRRLVAGRRAFTRVEPPSVLRASHAPGRQEPRSLARRSRAKPAVPLPVEISVARSIRWPELASDDQTPPSSPPRTLLSELLLRVVVRHVAVIRPVAVTAVVLLVVDRRVRRHAVLLRLRVI